MPSEWARRVVAEMTTNAERGILLLYCAVKDSLTASAYPTCIMRIRGLGSYFEARKLPDGTHRVFYAERGLLGTDIHGVNDVLD